MFLSKNKQYTVFNKYLHGLGLIPCLHYPTLVALKKNIEHLFSI